MYGLWVARVVSSFSFMPGLPGSHVIHAKATSIASAHASGSPVALPPLSWSINALPQTAAHDAADEMVLRDAAERIELVISLDDQSPVLKMHIANTQATKGRQISSSPLATTSSVTTSDQKIEDVTKLADAQNSEVSSWYDAGIRLVPTTTERIETRAFACILKRKSEALEAATAQALSAKARAQASEAAALAASAEAAVAAAEAAAAKAKLAVVEAALSSKLEAERCELADAESRRSKTAARAERTAKAKTIVSFLQSRKPVAPRQAPDARPRGIQVAKAPTASQKERAQAFYRTAPKEPFESALITPPPPPKETKDAQTEPRTAPSQRWIVHTYDEHRPTSAPALIRGGDAATEDELGI